MLGDDPPAFVFVRCAQAEGSVLALAEADLHLCHRLGQRRPDSRLEQTHLGHDLLAVAPAHAPDGFLLHRGQRFAWMIAQPRRPVGCVAVIVVDRQACWPVGGLFDAEVGTDLVLEAQLPGPGARGVVAPEAAVRHAQGRIFLAFGVDPLRPVAHGEVRPVKVLAALGRGQLFPPLRRVLPLRRQQRPQRGGVDHHAVVEVGVVGGIDLAVRTPGIGGRRAEVGALLDAGDQLGQLALPAQDLVVAPLGLARGRGVVAVARRSEVGELAVETGEGGAEVVGEQDAQGLRVPAVDGDPGDEGLLGRR